MSHFARITALTCLLAAGSAPAMDLETLARKLATTYAGLKSFSVTAKVQSRFQDDFMKYREESGQSLLIHWPSSSGEYEYVAKDNMFGIDNKNWWGDGTVQTDKLEAWDGLTWQSLSRKDPKRPYLLIAQKRQGGQEAQAHVASPLGWGFSFLLAATARPSDGNFPEDDYQWRVTLDKMRDKRVWYAFSQRLKGQVQLIDYQEQPCWKFSVDGGIARGDRSTKIYYTIWLPWAAPVYPIKYECRRHDDNYLLGVSEVSEFCAAVDIGTGTPLRFPKKLRHTSYTSDPRWRNKVVSFNDVEFSDCQFNPPLSDDAFKIDREQASHVTFLDTGKMFYRDKKGNWRSQ
jgi:hypothetical protein